MKSKRVRDFSPAWCLFVLSNKTKQLVVKVVVVVVVVVVVAAAAVLQ